MKFCSCGEDCKPYKDARGIWLCSKCGEKIKQNKTGIVDIDLTDDEEPQDEEEFEI